MSKRYFIDVSRKDTGLVSYFPVSEVMKEPDDLWVEKVLLPTLVPLVKRRDKTISNVPLTFWATVRETARRRAEAFVFVTPGRPGARIEEALKKLLEPIKGAHVHAGRESIPEDAFPCFQMFRNRVIRFYFVTEGDESLYIAMIRRGTGFPKLILQAIPEDIDWINIDTPIENMGYFFARAEISTFQTGQLLRSFQRALGTIARQENLQTTSEG